MISTTHPHADLPGKPGDAPHQGVARPSPAAPTLGLPREPQVKECQVTQCDHGIPITRTACAGSGLPMLSTPPTNLTTNLTNQPTLWSPTPLMMVETLL